ncbi:MAG: hypothetical protein RL431_498 [Actinomycetota bacterium]
MDARGVIMIHSAPPSLRPHIEWAISRVLGVAYRLEWSAQPAQLGTFRAQCAWDGPHGSAAALASALRGWVDTRFDVTEEVAHGRDGVRFVHTPSLGIFYTQIDSAGNSVITEDRVRYAIDIADGDARTMARELAIALGEAWDMELEPYRTGTPIESTRSLATRA